MFSFGSDMKFLRPCSEGVLYCFLASEPVLLYYGYFRETKTRATAETEAVKEMAEWRRHSSSSSATRSSLREVSASIIVIIVCRWIMNLVLAVGLWAMKNNKKT